MAAALTSLLKGKHKTLTWGPEVEQTLNTLKHHFMTAPILRYPDPEFQFLVEINASDSRVRAVLFQRQGNPLKSTHVHSFLGS